MFAREPIFASSKKEQSKYNSPRKPRQSYQSDSRNSDRSFERKNYDRRDKPNRYSSNNEDYKPKYGSKRPMKIDQDQDEPFYPLDELYLNENENSNTTKSTTKDGFTFISDRETSPRQFKQRDQSRSQSKSWERSSDRSRPRKSMENRNREYRERDAPKQRYERESSSTPPPPKQYHNPEKPKISADRICGTLHWYKQKQRDCDIDAGYPLETLHEYFQQSDKYDSTIVSGEFLYGLHSIHSCISRNEREIYGILTDKMPSDLKESSPIHKQLVSLANERKIPIITTSTGRLEQLSGGFGNRHNSVILVCSIFQPRSSNLFNDYNPEIIIPSDKLLTPPHKYEPRNEGDQPVWVALDRIQDPHNMGAILRSAWFYGIHGVIVPLKGSCPINSTCANISTGAVEQLPIYYSKNLPGLLKLCSENEWQTIGTSSNSSEVTMNAIPLTNITVDKPTIIVLGNEGEGVSSRILDSCSKIVTIPKNRIPPSAEYSPCQSQFPQHELDLSLNVSVAAGVIFNHLTQGNNFSQNKE